MHEGSGVPVNKDHKLEHGLIGEKYGLGEIPYRSTGSVGYTSTLVYKSNKQLLAILAPDNVGNLSLD